jgi:hypothetical protein
MDSMTIDYIELGKAIAANTPAPTNAGEWSIFGILIAVLVIMNVMSWAYFVWEKKQSIERETKLTDTMDKVKATMERLIAYFDQNDIKQDVQKMSTDIALINQKLDK